MTCAGPQILYEPLAYIASSCFSHIFMKHEKEEEQPVSQTHINLPTQSYSWPVKQEESAADCTYSAHCPAHFLKVPV